MIMDTSWRSKERLPEVSNIIQVENTRGETIS